MVEMFLGNVYYKYIVILESEVPYMWQYGKKIMACVLACTMVIGSMAGGVMISDKSAKAKDTDVEIVIDGGDVESAAGNVNGLTYKGFGLLSANSTSNLLMDYKAQDPYAYNKLLNVLFGGEHPLMNHIKMEMGNDGNNSTGADSCTMRDEYEDADASRSPGFILAADAKKINPEIKVSILRWEMPSWVQNYWNKDKKGKGYEAVYTWYKETILDAYEKYGYMLDYINPDKNETWSPDVDFIKWFKERLSTDEDFPEYVSDEAAELYRSTKIIASDENTSLNIVPEMRKDNALYDAVDAIGFHYSTGTADSTKDYVAMAEQDDKEVWYSEGCGSFSYSEYQENKTVSYGSGTLGGYQSPIAMCDCMIKSAVYSRKTHYIFQPAIGSFYEGSQYDHKELVSAREPWSGNIHYDEAIYCLSHFYKFAKTGWENENNTAGIWRYIAQASDNNSNGTEHLTNEAGNPSYMTLASPDKKDFSTVVVNNSDKTLSYRIYADNMDIPSRKTLEMWETKTDSYLKHVADIKDEGEGYIFEVEPFSVVTVTTLSCDGKEEYMNRLPENEIGAVLDTDETGSFQDTAGNILYADDYEYASYDKDYLKSRGYEPRYTVDYSGAFFVEDGKLKQSLTSSISQWQNNTPNAVIGDFRWMNYEAGVDVTVPSSGYAGIVIREQTGMGYTGSGYSLQIDKSGAWKLKKRDADISSGNVAESSDGTYRLALRGNDNVITAIINGEQVYEYTDNAAEYFGRIRLFSGWNEAYYDNLAVKKIDGAIPYGCSIIDNAADAVSYTGSWEIAANGSSNDWYRSTSKSSSKGASFTFPISTDGFSLIGSNSGNAVVDIICDGETIESDVRVNSSNQHCSFLMCDGLGAKNHEVTIVLKSGTLVLDAIMPIGHIPVTVTGISFENAVKELNIGETYEQKALVLPENADNKSVHYTVSDTAVVNVDGETGKVTALAGGEAYIYAVSADGSRKSASYKISVKQTAQQTETPNQVVTPNPVQNNNNNINTANETKIPKAPKLKKVKVVKGKVKLTWKKVSNASGYVVERSIGNKKKFKKIKAISKNNKISYIDKKASKKKKNYYRVKSYTTTDGKKAYSKYSAVKAVKYKK